MFSMLEVLPVLLGWRIHSAFCWHTSPASSRFFSVLRGFDATRRLVSNKLEFAQFGAHMKKFWQFCFSPCGSTAVAAVVPLVASSGSTAPVPLYYRLDFGSYSFRVGFSSSCMAVRHGSTAYKR